MRHPRNPLLRLEISGVAQTGTVKDITLLIVVERQSRHLFNHALKHLKRRVDVFVSLTRLKAELPQRVHKSHALLIGGMEHPLTVGARTRINHPRRMAHQMRQPDFTPLATFIRQEISHRIVGTQQPAVGKRQHASHRKLL